MDKPLWSTPELVYLSSAGSAETGRIPWNREARDLRL